MFDSTSRCPTNANIVRFSYIPLGLYLVKFNAVRFSARTYSRLNLTRHMPPGCGSRDSCCMRSNVYRNTARFI